VREFVDLSRRSCSKAIVSVITGCGATMRLTAFASEQAGTAAIVDSGSTNTAGFRILVQRSGEAEQTQTPRRYGPQTASKARKRQLPRALVDRFYSDLDAAKPFSALPEQHCMKSASFGTTLSIEFAGEKTPDLNCGDGGDSKLQAIIRDATEIIKLFSPSEGSAPSKPE